MDIKKELFGNADKLLPSLWDMVSYPFGGGTSKEDQAYTKGQFEALNQVRNVEKMNASGKVNLYGNYTGIGPPLVVAKPLTQAIADQTVIPMPSGSTYIVYAIGALLLIKLMK